MFRADTPPRVMLLHAREDLSSLTAYASSSRLSADLGNACEDKEGADVFVVARDRSRFLAHRAVIACRSTVLEQLLADASASEGKGKSADAGKVLDNLLVTFGTFSSTRTCNVYHYRPSAMGRLALG